MNRPVYIQGIALVSRLGANLSQATACMASPPMPEWLSIPALDARYPYFRIGEAGSPFPDSVESWWDRAAKLISGALEEAGVSDFSQPLYLASSTGPIGAAELADQPANELERFFADFRHYCRWQGPIHWVNSACTSSNCALQLASEVIAGGVANQAVILGLELYSNLCASGFAAMQILSKSGAKPLAKDRDGLVLGEAVSVIALGSQKAKWRIAACAHSVNEEVSGAASVTSYEQVVRHALLSANLDAGDIHLIKMQASGSPVNDPIEQGALCRLFDPMPNLISYKGILGHCLGAAGAAELALLIAAEQQHIWPAIQVSAQDLDPEITLNFSAGWPAQLNQLLLCNLGFGGSHSALVLQRA